MPDKKPPLGVMPEKLWLEDRISCLLRALHEYQYKQGKIDLMVRMSVEMTEHLRRLLNLAVDATLEEVEGKEAGP